MLEQETLNALLNMRSLADMDIYRIKTQKQFINLEDFGIYNDRFIFSEGDKQL